MSDLGNQSVVLVVDDNETNRDVLSRRIMRYGHHVETASHGREALKLIHEKEFDLVLLDIMMPDMTGYDVLERIKDNPDFRSLPVIVISALDDIDSVVQCIQLGAEDYLSKPFNPLILQARITASLEKKRLRDKEQEHLEEQSITQRIDRELNTRLNIKSTAELTLDWAIRRSGVSAALIGKVVEDGLQVLASQGCDQVLQYYDNGIVPIDSQPLIRAVETILPQSSTDRQGFITPKAQKQVIMPIGRAGQVIALLILESTTPDHFTNKILSFLTRLSDRAAIALSNAQLYEAVQEANVAKSEFISDVSHELKNPMTSILNFAKMMKDAGPINEVQQSYVETIVNNVDRMKRLVQDLGDLSKIETGHLRLDLESVDVISAIHEVVLSLQAQVDAKGQEIILDLDEDLPNAWADFSRIVQVLTNLVSNSHKYTQSGGKITIKATHSDSSKMVNVTVRDNGIGLREEDQQKIFQKYFRAADIKQTIVGTGLGLNITKTLVELQGGQIWFESEFQKGTAFHFCIPIATWDNGFQ